MSNSRAGYVKASDGTSLYYETAGQGSPAFVLFSGIGCDSTFWKYIIRDFRKNHQILSWHYKGHGFSELPRNWKSLTIPGVVEDALIIMKHVGIDKAVLFGHSMGVQVILEFFRRHRKRALGLVPICGALGHPFNHFLHTGLSRKFFPLPYLAGTCLPRWTHKFVNEVIESPLSRPIAWTIGVNRYLMKDEDLDQYMNHLKKMHPKVFMMMAEGMKDHTAESWLTEVDIPTLIIAGTKDHFTPYWMSLKLFEAVKHSELITIPEGSHAAHVEMPRFANRAIRKFIAKHYGK